uniref:biotin/lipoyl-containing protein n=1 Tax=Guyparkeria sp. TaxID=2035736 RepID=UPI00356712A0
MTIETINLPDIGNFDEVEIIEVLVEAGDTIEAEDSLITLETDKATMEIPAPAAGTITEMLVGVGDKVSTGKPIAKYEPAADGGEEEKSEASAAQSPAPAGEEKTAAPAAAAPTDANADVECEVCVLGSGPGGYTAAFRAADLGKKVVLIERYPVIGGVCLNVGCIPSKALLHVSEVLNETRSMGAHGVTFAEPEIDLDKLRGFKEKTIKKLTGGLEALAKQRKVQIVRGYGRFVDPHHVAVTDDDGKETLIRFD